MTLIGRNLPRHGLLARPHLAGAGPALVLAAALGLSGCGTDGAGSGATDGNGTGGEDAGDGDLPPEFGGPVSLELRSETSIAVSWAPGSDDLTPAGALRYHVYTGTSAGAVNFEQPRASTGPGVTELTLDDLTPGKTVFVVVRAVDERDQESGNADPYSITTVDATAPTFGGIEALTAISGSELQATWTEAMDAGTAPGDMIYEIFVATASGSQNFETATVTTPAGASSAVIGGLDEYTDYFAIVRAIDESGNVAQSFVERSARTLDATAPTFAGATGAVAAGAAIQVQWDLATDNVDAPIDIRYNVYANIDTTPGFGTPVATTQPGASSYGLTSLPLNTHYKIVVRAVDSSGNEDDNTVEVSATTGATADESPPTFNGIILLQATGPTSLYAAWDPASDDTTAEGNLVYDLFVSTSDGGQDFMVPFLTTGPGETNANLNGLLPDTEYWVVVRARDISGNSDTNTVQAATFTDPDIEAPTFAGVDGVAAPSPTALQVSWSAGVDNVTAASDLVYLVFEGADAGSVDFGNSVFVSAPGQLGWTRSGLEPLTQRCYAVRAEDEYGNRDSNTEVICRTTQADTTAPKFDGITAVSQINPTTMRVFWDPATDNVDPHEEIEYLVYWGPAGNLGYGTPAAVSAPGAVDLLLTGLPPATKLDFAVRARDEAGNVDTNTVVITDETLPDVTVPKFDGAQSIAATSTSVEVFWNEAVDNVTTGPNIRYEVCGGRCFGSDAVCKVGAQLPQNCAYYVSNEPAFPATIVNVQGQLSRFVGSLDPDSKMFYQVRAVDEAGNASAWEPWVSATTLTDVTPPTFAGIASATVQGASQIDLTWIAGTDPETAQGSLVYDVYWRVGAGAFNFNAPNATTAAGATGYSITGLSPQTTYYMVVKARDQAGNRSTNTATTNRTTAADLTPPANVTVSTASGGECNVMSVSWQATTDNAASHAQLDYQICASTSSTGCATNFAGNLRKTVTGTTSTTINVPAGDNTWYVRVRAVDPSGNIGGSANQLSGFVNDSQAPYWGGGAVLSAVREVPTFNTSGRIQLTWPEAIDACMANSTVRYEICRWPNARGTSCVSSFVDDYPSTSTLESRLITGLSTDTTYWFYVRPKDTNGNTSTSTRSASDKTHTSYAQNVFPQVYNAAAGVGGCVGCHHSWTRANTVNVNSACNASYRYVNPNSSNTSVIYRQMTGSQICPTQGQMPLSGPFSATLQGIVQNWINQGAHNN